MRNYINLLRCKHYIKNIIIFLPLFFGERIFEISYVLKGTMGFFAFCAVSSAVYILNDIKDIDYDRKHPTKKNRPLASGKISIGNGIVVMVSCILLATIISVILGNINGVVFLMLYLGLNVAYSFGFKNYPIIDVAILASGFVIRMFYGGCITEVEISNWLYLVVITGSLYMGLGKRRNELKRQSHTRGVLKYYNVNFLDKNMYVCLALANVFYSLWAMEMTNSLVIWTVPLFIILLMRYSLDAEGDSDGDPVEVVLHDKVLIGMVIVYVICIFSLLYFV